MSRLMDVFGKLAFALLAIWVVLAGLGLTEMPGTKKEEAKKRTHKHAHGDVWQQPVCAPMAEDNLAFPAAYL